MNFSLNLKLNFALLFSLLFLVMAGVGCPQKKAANKKGKPKASPPKVVSAQWLYKNKDRKKIVILDVSPGKFYRQGHIPGARNAFTLKAFSPDQEGLKSQVITESKKMEKTLQTLGLNKDSHVIITWQGDHIKDVYYATKAFFVLHNFGVKTSLLNGGVQAWKQAGYSLSKKKVSPEKGNITLGEFNKKALAEMEEVRKAKNLIDARPPAFYRGEKQKPYVARKGTIPGAKNIPFTTFLKEDGTFKSPSEIKKILEKHNVSDETIVFCNSANTATINWFVFKVFGEKSSRLYDGSMNEWASKKENPVVKGKNGK